MIRDSTMGKIYRISNATEMLELLKKEKGLAWTAHARTKGSTGFPDGYWNQDFFLSDRFLGAAWKAMPADLSQPRLGKRVLDLMDDMNNRGLQKKISGTPNKSRIRRAIENLKDARLLKEIKDDKYLIFELPLATRGFSGSKKLGTNSTHYLDTQADTNSTQQTLDVPTTSNKIKAQADTQPDTPKITYLDTHLLSGKDKEKELLLRNSSKKKVETELSTDFQVTDEHVRYAAVNSLPSPHEHIAHFREYHLANGSRKFNWDMAFYTWLRNTIKFNGGNNNGNSNNRKRSANSGLDSLFESLAKHRQTMQH